MNRAMMAIVVAGTILLGTAGPASAAPSGPLNVTIINVTTPDGFQGRAILTGAVNASCNDGPPATTFGPHGAVHLEDKFVCPHGTIFVSADGFANRQLEPVTCIGHVPSSGTFNITGGTGEFAGANGGGTFTGHALFVFQRSAQGCSTHQPPRLQFLRVNLSGNLLL